MSLTDNVKIAVSYDDSIGINYFEGKPVVTLPQGIHFKGEEDLNKVMKKFLKSISIYKKTTKKNMSIEERRTFNKHGLEFPYEAYSNIINYYMMNGVYEELETRWEREYNIQKVSWNRTFKYVNPIYKNGKPIYLEFINKKTNCKEKSIMKEIFILALNLAYKKIGFLYNNMYIPTTNFNRYKYAINILKKKLQNENIDSKKILFNNIIEVLSGANNDNYIQNSFEVNRVEYYWEFLIDRCFNNSVLNSNMYATWRIGEKTIKTSPGRPDTINVQKNTINVIDAKYYQYGLIKNGSLPGISDIVKQVAYAKYLHQAHNKKIKNIFLLPGKLNDDYVKKIGYAELVEDRIDTYLVDIRKLVFSLTDQNIRKAFNRKMRFDY